MFQIYLINDFFSFLMLLEVVFPSQMNNQT